MPERWLRQVSSKSRQIASFAFGAGSREGLGKHIDLPRVSTVIPQVARNLDLDICEASGSTMPTRWPRYTCRVEERRMGREGLDT
ncbi:hypothetical protein HRG_013781 [Hirsutella rhossiliensis]